MICTCHSHQFVLCRGAEGLGAGWVCEDDMRLRRTGGERPDNADAPTEQPEIIK